MGKTCARCGSTLAPDAPEALCSVCVLGAASETSFGEGVSLSVIEAGGADGLDDGLCLQPGDHFGPYRIERLLGRGGMGDVYAAEHLEQGRRLAIKLLSRRLTGAENRDRFLKEGQLAAAVNHPNSVYVFGSEEVAGIPVISMELLPGGTLKDRVKQRGPLSISEAVDAILQVIAGLQAAHSSGVLHRDVKPSNCFVDVDQTVKIGDFGLSIPTQPPPSRHGVHIRAFQGTPGFASPEQLRGEALDLRADIYAVGATLFYLLTAEAPGGHRGLSALAAGIDTAPVRSPRDLRPEIPKPLAALILRCLAAERAARPGSYEELTAALAPFGSAFGKPATIGPRIAARLFDAVVLLLIIAPCMAAVVVSRLVTSEGPAVFLGALLPITLYFGIGDGVFGATFGKRRCGVQVVGLHGATPGLVRGFVRSAACVVPLGLALAIRTHPSLFAWAGAPPMSALGLGLVVLFSTALNNKFRGLHDRLAGTRVILVPKNEAAPTVDTHAEPLIPLGQPDRQFGPYVAVASLGLTDTGEILIAFDPWLKRQVWIHTQPIDTAPLLPSIRSVGRPTRLRWLNGQRTDVLAWDAYEAPDGRPLLDRRAPVSWQITRQWLLDLGTELDAGVADGSLGPLSLDRVWITREHRLKLLDFRGPGVSTRAPSAPVSAMTLLRDLIDCALAGVPPATLPLTSSSIRRGLSRGDFASPAALVATLSGSADVRDQVTRTQRGVAGTATLLTYLIGGPIVTVVLLAVSSQVAPSASLTSKAEILGALGSVTIGLAWAAWLRGGFWLHAFGIAVVTEDGREVSRLRAVARAGAAWVLVPAAAVVKVLGVPPLVLGITAAQLLFTAYATDHPNRGVQDRLAGTFLVPR